jgi:hypothetical protein
LCALARRRKPNLSPTPQKPTKTANTTVAAAPAASACTRAISGYSGFFGAPAKQPSDHFVSQLTRWQAGGDMRKLQLFFSFDQGCVLGVKPTYGPVAGNGSALLGLEAGLTGLHLVLQPGERFVEAQHKSGVR